ncbi:MAG: HEAT repeat domain-containing protein [Gammaproteobacteria bacterium]|nr:HEAT repeat domain-containing protein [Gammaproteobacteria bacterium]
MTFQQILEQTRDADPDVRAQAVQALCGCRLKVNEVAAWDRILEMCTDPDAKVGSLVSHTLCDGSPREREQDIVIALDEMANDPDRRLRRPIRRRFADYRRGGRLNTLCCSIGGE